MSYCGRSSVVRTKGRRCSRSSKSSRVRMRRSMVFCGAKTTFSLRRPSLLKPMSVTWWYSPSGRLVSSLMVCIFTSSKGIVLAGLGEDGLFGGEAFDDLLGRDAGWWSRIDFAEAAIVLRLCGEAEESQRCTEIEGA